MKERSPNACLARLPKLVMLLGLLLTACAKHHAFDTSFPVNRESDLAAVLAQVRARPRAPVRPVVVGLADTPRRVFAYDIAAQKLLWQHPASATGVPVPAGEFVVVPEGDKLRVRSLENGSVALELMTQGLELVGSDGDGPLTAIVLSTGGSMGARSRLVLLEGTRVAFDTTVKEPMGAPAVVGGLAFVPHNRVHLSVLDGAGSERVRVRIRDDVASYAFARGGEVYFGMLGLYRLDERSGQGANRGAAYYRVKRSDALPGQPRFLPDTTVPPLPPDSAVHRVSLTFAPAAPDAKLHLADDALYLVFYRQLYALEADGKSAHWVHQSPADIVGAQGVLGGVVFVDDQGTVSAVNRHGQQTLNADMGIKPLVARVRAERLPTEAPAGPEPSPLALQLYEAAIHSDTRLVPARTLAVELLATLDEADATQALIELCQDRASPDRVRRAACVSLRKRSLGSDAVVEALARHADYLAGTPAPPVGALAEAAVHSRDARAIPGLIAHLRAPETPVEDLSAIMLALKELADPSIAEPLADFLRMYHADAEDNRLADALVLAVDILATLQGPQAQSVLEPIANDSLATPAVRSAAAKALASMVEVGEQPEPNEPAQAAQPAAPVPVVEGPPARLTAAHVDQALAPYREQLRQCVRADEKRPMSARITIVVEGDGTVAMVQTLPESLRSCIEPLVRRASFPATTWGKRDTLSTTITR